MDWKLELKTKEALICFDLSLKLKPNNEIYLSEKEMYEYCGYKSSRYFKKHLQNLIDKGIIFKFESEKVSYYFNPFYVQYNELGPKFFHRPLMDNETLMETIKELVNQC